MRAIDADALQLAIVEEGQANKRKKYTIGDIWELTGAEIREVINSQPTIQPKRGRWLLVCDNNGMHFICNKCSAWRYHQEQKFCGECGADMRKVTT